MHTRTTTQLLDDLKDPANGEAWVGFERRYRPVLLGFARELGCSAADAADVAQQALLECVTGLREGRYDRGKGRLSSWLIGIAHNLISEVHRRARVRREAGDSVLAAVSAQVPDDAHISRIWQKQRELAILSEAFEELRRSTRMEEHTLRVFELYALRGVPVEEVAAQCGVEVDSVYVIKNRLILRLREIMRQLATAYEEE
ncbi:MAG: sigma-70 family RNA polymerase sigma factor [Phycisphaerales bacterium]|nr:sigma-70 family RNA polymerase sigma factor [Phycisphaerales bacterium]